MSTELQIFIFILCFLGIIVAAFWSIEAIKTISETFNLSSTFIGAVFLSIGTSFPEFINSIIAGVKDISKTTPNQSSNSFYNITGANIWQIVFLSGIMIFVAIHYYRKKATSHLDQISLIFWKDSFLSWKLVFIETSVLLCMFIFPALFSYLTVGGFNLMNLIFFSIWIFYIIHTYKSNSSSENNESATYFKNLGKTKLILVTMILWILFGTLSYVNFLLSDQFSNTIGKSTSFGVLLSFVTSTPEFSVMILLFRQHQYKMAVSGFFGSSIFNLTLPTYSNLISQNTIFGRNNFDEYINNNFGIVSWIYLNILILIGFLMVFWKNKQWRTSIVTLSGLTIISLYTTTVILI